jgi:Ras family
MSLVLPWQNSSALFNWPPVSVTCRKSLTGEPVVTLIYFVQESFMRAQNWIAELQKQANPNIVIALAGNKTDLDNIRTVSFEASICFLLIIPRELFHHSIMLLKMYLFSLIGT